MVKQMVLVALVLFGFLNAGYSIRCHRCSGDIQKCNVDTAATDTCAVEKTQCVSTVLHTESGINYFFGCADSMDCQAARASCAQITEQNPGTSCNATCCADSDGCVKPKAADYDPQECYMCSSMEDCKMATLTQCSNEQERCFKLTGDFTRQGIKSMFYMKGCATINQCENMEKNVLYNACPNQESCHMSCCEGDKCNAGSNAVVSASTLLACAIVAVVRLQ